MMKRTRTFEPTLENQLKTYKSDFTYVNPFSLMMEAAKQQSHRHAGGSDSGGWSDQNMHSSSIPCSHCGRQLAYPQATQCDGCKQVFCGCCSVADYEEREVRTFCLDCHAAGGCPEDDYTLPPCSSPWQIPAGGAAAAAGAPGAAAAAADGGGDAAAGEPRSSSPPWMRRGRSLLLQACTAAAAQPMSPLPFSLASGGGGGAAAAAGWGVSPGDGCWTPLQGAAGLQPLGVGGGHSGGVVLDTPCCL